METSFEIKLPGVLLIAPDMKMNFSLAEGIYKKSVNPNNKQHFEKFQAAVSDLKSDTTYLNCNFNLDTKYYSCDITFHLTTYDKVNNILADEQRWSNYGLKSIEGVLFVTNLADTAREGVKDYIDHHNHIMESLSPNISMCFANKPEALNLDINSILEFGENDYLIEIVEEDLSNPKTSEANKGGMTVEKYGIERIVENLECHIWPNMSKKTQTKSQEKSKNKEGSTDDKKGKSEDNQQGTKSVEKEKKSENIESPSGKNAADILAQKLFKDLEEDDEKEMDDLSNIFSSIQNFRQSSQGLTDEQRREQAANLIMKLVENCKDMGDDDEEDDDNEDINKEKI